MIRIAKWPVSKQRLLPVRGLPFRWLANYLCVLMYLYVCVYVYNIRHRKESSVATEHMLQLVGAFGKLPKATVSFVMSFCFRLHGTTPLPVVEVL